MPTSSLDTSILVVTVERCFIPSVVPSLLHYSQSVTRPCQTAIYLASPEEAENLSSPSGYTLCLTHWHCIYCKVRNSSNNLEKTATCRNSIFSFSGISEKQFHISHLLFATVYMSCRNVWRY